VRAGTYSAPGSGARNIPAFNPVNSGTSSQPIVFQSEGIVNLVLSSSNGPVMGASGRDYIAWRGFDIDEANVPSHADTGPVVLWDTRGSSIEDSLILGMGDPGFGDNHPGIRIEASSNLIVRNNLISNFRTSVVNGANGAGIQIYDSGDIIIERNEIIDCGSGIFLKATRAATDQYVIRYNLIRDSETGIAIHRSPNTAQAPIRVYQNIVTNAAMGIRLWAWAIDGTDPRNAKVVNNTVYNSDVGIYITGSMAPNSGHILWNNIVANSATYAVNYAGAISDFTSDRLQFRHNLYYNYNRFAIAYSTEHSLSTWTGSLGQDAGTPASLSANPQFVNPVLGNFRLQAGSPALNRGVDYFDLNGNGSTTDLVPLGAYVSGTETIGSTIDRPAPNPPGSVTVN
jgi:hypothetical protein